MTQGFYAWRGMLRHEDAPDVYDDFLKAYPNLHQWSGERDEKTSIIYDIARDPKTGYYKHAAIYELPGSKVQLHAVIVRAGSLPPL